MNYAELLRSLNLTRGAPQALIKSLNAVERQGLITIHDREGLTMWVNQIVDGVNWELTEELANLKRMLAHPR